MWDKDILKKAEEISDYIYSNFDNVTPSKSNALNFKNIEVEDIKVVIIGQDPYPTANVANGYAFAVNKGTKIPQSLNNVFKELKSNFGIVNTDETLESWVKQGVLLLNKTLTTIVGQSNVHKKYWNDFTTELIKYIDHSNRKIVWLLWGNDAIKLSKYIANGTVITDAHPSPLSVRHRSGKSFLEVNKYININW